jgi:hypothetical protein
MPAGGLGLVAIGTTPRDDYVEVFGSQVPPGTEITVVGALDPLRDSPGKIAALSTAHQPGDYPLLCRLPHDGTTLEVDLHVLFPYIAEAARKLGDAGCAAVVVCCCGNFPRVEGCSVPVLFPGRVLPAVSSAVCAAATPRIAVISPIEGQCAEAEKHWRAQGFDPVMGYGDWTAEDRGHLEETAAALAARDDLELVVLDCMGHDDEFRAFFAERCGGKPVLLAQSVIAKVAAELLPPGAAL